MEFRRATVEDAELLTELRLEMRRERETVPPPEDMKAFEKANLDFFKENIASNSYIGIIGFEAGKVVGTGGISLHNHPPSYGVPNGKSACLLNMYTRSQFRGQGVAGKILAALVEYARSAGCCKVYLNASDMGKPIYEKFGFKDVSNEMVFDLKN